MATVDFKRIDQVYDNLTATLIDTTASSKMSVAKQDSRLEESCRQVCDLLTDWLESDLWESLRASVGRPIADFVQDQEQFDRLLPTLQDVLERASGPLIKAVPEYVGQTREALRAAAVRDQKLFQKAEDKVGALKDEVCELAAQLRNRNATHEQKTNARVRARKRLATVIMLLPPLFMAMAGVTPHQAEKNLAQWGQILNVAAIQDIATRAEPPDRSPGSRRDDPEMPSKIPGRGPAPGPSIPGKGPAPRPRPPDGAPPKIPGRRQAPGPSIPGRGPAPRPRPPVGGPPDGAMLPPLEAHSGKKDRGS
jgi:hypothetical protein